MKKFFLLKFSKPKDYINKKLECKILSIYSDLKRENAIKKAKRGERFTLRSAVAEVVMRIEERQRESVERKYL